MLMYQIDAVPVDSECDLFPRRKPWVPLMDLPSRKFARSARHP